MRKFTLRFWIALLTFAFGVAATFLWLWFNPFPEQYEKVNFADVPTVEYCDLKNNPRRYDGKIIRLKDQLNWFMHGYFIPGRICLNESNSSSDEKDRIAVGFFSPKSEELGKNLEQWQIRGRYGNPVGIIAVGRFSYKNFLGDSDLMQDRTHLQFEIYNIELVSR